MERLISYTVTFKVVNGKWNEGEDDAATADKTVTLTGHDGDTLKLTADQIPAVGNKPNDTYKAGSWDTTPSTETEITAATTYTYTYAQKSSISQTVTFKVVNGSWDDETTTDKTVTLTGYEGDTLKLAANQIPSVGTKPNDTYKAGSWDTTPSAEIAITGATTYTYTYAAKAAQTITAENVTATYGDTGKSVSGTTDGDGAISYAVKSGDAVTVDANTGALTIVKAGTATVTVTAAETNDYAAATKDVTVTVNPKTMTVSAENVTVTVDGQPHSISVNVTDPASGYTVKYGTEAGTYDLDASPTQTEAGSLTVYYQVTADNYETYTGSATVTVSAKQTQTITASDVTATYGDTGKSVSASVTEPTTGGGTLSYAVKDGSEDYISVDASTGALTIKKAGTATVVVTAAETGDYAQATKEVTVTINKATPSYTVPTGLTATYGQTLANVTLPNADNGAWSWNDATTTSVGNVGTNTFKAIFTPKDTGNYNSVSNVDVTVTVAKATPTATAPTATATYGQTLANVTLTNPTGNTPGNWAWADALTTSVGNVGNNTFKANFTPTDTANYNSKSNVDVTVVVAPKPVTVSGIKAQDKTYDGTTRATLNYDDLTIGGVFETP